MNLTTEQIEQAARAFWGNASPSGFDNGRESARQVKLGLGAAAQFLQVPIAMPTDKEAEDVYNEMARNNTFSVPTVIRAFVRNRNTPKPVDPRREKIISALSRNSLSTTEDVADRILAALDAKE